MIRLLIVLIAAVLTAGPAWAAQAPPPVQMKKVPEQTVAALAFQTTLAKIGQDTPEAFKKLLAYIVRAGIQPTGPAIAVYYSPPEGLIDADVCVPVPEGAKGGDGVVVKTLEGGTMASIMHFGPYDRMAETYRAFMGWMSENGYKPAGPSREVYLVAPPVETDPEMYQTEILMPVAK